MANDKQLKAVCYAASLDILDEIIEHIQEVNSISILHKDVFNNLQTIQPLDEKPDIVLIFFNEFNPEHQKIIDEIAAFHLNSSFLLFGIKNDDFTKYAKIFDNNDKWDFQPYQSFKTTIEKRDFVAKHITRFSSFYRTYQILNQHKTISTAKITSHNRNPIDQFGLIAIACSTGGPEALHTILSSLPAELNVPILIVQHMPPAFTHQLADNLSKHSSIPIIEAQEGLLLKSNHIYIAPGGQHMVLKKCSELVYESHSYMISMNDNPPVKNCKPSANVLFDSIANKYSKRVLTIVLTGMGDDGKEGVQLLKENGAYCITQTEDTCIVYGMPKVVDQAGLSDEQIPLSSLAEKIVELISNPPPTIHEVNK